jgi:alkylated DNA repair dioxygenase AlkB
MEQLSWFPVGSSAADAPKCSDAQRTVEGLTLVPDFITDAEEQRLLTLLDDAEWSAELRRRVQHYGYRYDYQKRILSRDDYIGALPKWANVLGQRLVDAGLFSQLPDQVIVNEYLPGQGIAPHIDRETCFGEVVASLSLASSVVMDFTRVDQRIGIELPARSVVALRGSARYEWRHGITARRTDRINGRTVERTRRVSLTFRTTIGENGS